MINIAYITIFLILNNETYIFCYYIEIKNDNSTFHLYVSYMSFIIIFLTISVSVIFFIYVTIFIEEVKDLKKFPFPILIYTSIGKLTILVTSNQRTLNSQEIAGFCGGIDLNTSVNHRLQVN